MDHKYRSNARAFNGRTEYRPPPALLEGEDILELLENFNNVFGKMQKKLSDGLWKKNSNYSELSYWKHNTLCHNLDMMHIEKKNIFDNIIETCWISWERQKIMRKLILAYKTWVLERNYIPKRQIKVKK